MTSTSKPAGNGWNWIAEAWALFLRAPVVWVVIAVLYIVLTGAMNLVLPVIGTIASSVLTPVFFGGVMLGCRRQHEGGALQVGDLFAGFRTRFGTLAGIGALSLAVMLAIVFVAGVLTGVNLFVVLGNPDPNAIYAAALGILLTLLVASALMLPLAMALWFAPPLVVFRELGVFQAMGLSFAACLKNMMPFLIYGLVLLVAAVLASIPAGLGWLVLLPVLFASVYTAYRDIFPS